MGDWTKGLRFSGGGGDRAAYKGRGAVTPAHAPPGSARLPPSSARAAEPSARRHVLSDEAGSHKQAWLAAKL